MLTRTSSGPSLAIAVTLVACLLGLASPLLVAGDFVASSSPVDLQFRRYIRCPPSANCSSLPAACLSCTYDLNCTYGLATVANCSVAENVTCIGERDFPVSTACQFCYQSPSYAYTCSLSDDCDSRATQNKHVAMCTMRDEYFCAGSRSFKKNVACNWTSGKKWSTALILSITVGGFGADLFYLGYIGWGLFKLFSFGGLGLWTLVDIVLIATGYLGPADGSVYI